MPAPLADIEAAAGAWLTDRAAELSLATQAFTTRETPSLLSRDSPINLVVAVEYDLNHPDQDSREGYDRHLQIAQWTTMARPMHPVFLDVLETATRHLDRMIDGDTMWHGIDVVSLPSCT